MNQEILEEKLAELPLYCYQFFDPQELEFSQRVRWICEHDAPCTAKAGQCPPGVGQRGDMCRRSVCATKTA